MMPTLDPLPVWIAAACIAALLAHAAVAKWADRALFEQHLAAYGLPALLRGPALWGIPAAEALLALGLLGPWRMAAAVGSAALLLAYGGAMAWHLLRGHVLDCGCGGEPLPLSWALVLRNAALAALALLAGAPPADRTLSAADLAVLVAALLLASLLHAALHQVLRHAPAARRATRPVPH